MKRVIGVLLAVVVSAALAGCGAIERWFMPSTRIQLGEVKSLTIEQSWVGLAPMYASTYLLTEKDGAWVGTVVFTYGSGDDVTRQEEITIPADAVARFIEVMDAAIAYEGEYEPYFDHTDDYPYIGFTFETDAGTVEVYSASQGEDAVPWGATIDGVKYTIDSDIPARALDEIAQYLKYEERQAFLDEAR